MVASRRRTSPCSLTERAMSSCNARRQQGDRFRVAGFAGGEPHLALFLVRLRERHFAFLDRAVQQQPGGELHQPRGQPHALGRIDQSSVALELLGFLAARAVEIARGLLDQRHAVAKQGREDLGTRQPLAERYRAGFTRTLLGHGYASPQRVASRGLLSESSDEAGKQAAGRRHSCREREFKARPSA